MQKSLIEYYRFRVVWKQLALQRFFEDRRGRQPQKFSLPAPACGRPQRSK